MQSPLGDPSGESRVGFFMDYRLQSFLREHLPADKKEFSRDMVELLIKLAWEQARESQRSDRAVQDEEDRYGPRYI